MKKRDIRLSGFMIGLLLTILFGVLLGIHLEFLETLELKSYDLRVRLRQNLNADHDISIVEIDDNSISKIGPWPWPSGKFADIIEILHKAGARTIALGFIFNEPQQDAGISGIKDLRQHYAAPGLSKDEKDGKLGPRQNLPTFIGLMDNDAELAHAMQKAQNVILPMYFTTSQGPQGPLKEKSRNIPQYILDQAYVFVGKTELFSLTNMPRGENLIYPTPELSQAASGIGHINVNKDIDGITRADTLVMECEKDYFPSFSVQIARNYMGLEMDEIRVLFGEGILLGKTIIPADSQMRMLLSFYGPNRAFPYFSFYDVMNENVELSHFKDKIVIIGITAAGIYDALVTPASSKFPRVEYEATAVQNLLHQNYIQRPSWMGLVEFGLLIFFGVFSFIALPRLRAKRGIIMSALMLCAFIVGATALFVSQGLWLKITYPSLLLVLSSAIISTRHFFVPGRAKEKVDAESTETNKMLGIDFQRQGMLDMAFEKFRKCPLDDSIKGILYKLGLDYELKKQFKKAREVFEHIAARDYNFEDIQERIRWLKAAGETMNFGRGGKRRTPVSQTMTINSGAKKFLGRYEVTGEIGKGAMGSVYKGVDAKLGRIVAIKTIRFDHELESNRIEEMKERFFAGAKAAAGLNHPNIVKIYEMGENYGLPWIAMEFVKGETLEKYTKKENLLPLRRVLAIVADVSGALDYAHQHYIVHRDIKPANIMLLNNGEVKVTDFGIASIASAPSRQTEFILGTPRYMSPEQVMGKKIDGRSDIFSLGVVFYELLTGEKPFQGDNIDAVMHKIANERHPNPKIKNDRIPDVFVKIINKALQKNVERRYQKAGELRNHCQIIIQKINQKRVARARSSL